MNGFADMPIEELREKVLAAKPKDALLGDSIEDLAQRLQRKDAEQASVEHG